MGALSRRRLSSLLVMIAAAGMWAAVPSSLASAATGDLSTVAGTVLGTATTATSVAMGPRGVAVSGSNLYIADQDSNAVRKVDLSTGIATVVAGTGAPNNSGDGGAATSAGINNPYDVTLDNSGNPIIASTSNHRIRKLDLSTGIITTVAGTSNGNSGDGGAATSAKIQNPYGVAVAANGDYYIADTDNKQIRKVTVATGIISTFATFTGTSVPDDIAFDSAGNVYVTDCGTNKITRFPAAGGAGTVVAGVGGVNAFSGDGGAATAANLACPIGIYIDSSNVIYFSDSVNDRLRKFTVGGNISTWAGTGATGLSGDGGLATAATLDKPTDLTSDGAGTFYFAQGAVMGTSSTATTAVVRKISAAGVVSTVAGSTWRSYSGDGAAATGAQLGHPAGVAVDSSDNLYIADTNNNRIRKVTTGGVISTVAGNGFPCTGACGAANIGDGGAATSGNLSGPQAVAVGTTGDLYIADTLHNRIRKVSGGVITTLAGTGSAGSTDGAAASATFNSPYSLTVTAAGAVYVADRGSNKIRLISGGTVSTVTGTGASGYTGNGGAATSATLNAPSDVKVDSLGDIYIADTGNNVVRKVHSGVISTVAGSGTSCGAACTTGQAAGDGGLATSALLTSPAGILVDSIGNLYIADTGMHTLRRVDRHGVIHNLVGKYGSGSWVGDGAAGASASARLFGPARMALDSAGNLYIASSGEMRIRRLAVEASAPTFWVSDSTTGQTRTTYGWELVSQTATAIGKITFTVPSATNSSATGLYLVSVVNLPSTGTLSLSGGTLTYTLASPVTLAAGVHAYLSVSGFTNTGTAGLYYSTVTTQTSGGATVDSSSSGAVSFTAAAAAVLVLPNANELVTASSTTTVYVDPMLGGDTVQAIPITIQTNATHGYSLTVKGTSLTGTGGTIAQVSTGQATAVASASFGANKIGYTVTGVGGSGAGSAAAALSGAYAGYTAAGETAVTATRPTSVTGDVVALTNRVKVDRLLPAGVYSGSLTYVVTPSY
jgi:hypothetical protein